MKKIISILLALSMMLTMLAACNNEPVEDVENPDNRQEDVRGDDKVEEPFDGTLKLVVEGVSDYVIVRGENATPSEITATTELQAYLKQISGAELAIVDDSTAPVEKEIVVGKTNRESDGEFDRAELGDDGFVIKTNGKKLFLVGGRRGTLYAAYEFLEAYLGCRFFLPEVERVPEQKTISIEPIAEDKQIPVFIDRMTSWPEYDKGGAEILAKRRLTENSSVGEEWGGTFSWIRWCHTFEELVPISVYGEEHPEWFTIDVSEYGYTSTGMRVDGQICLTNPEVLAVAIETTRNILNGYKNNPNSKIISITQNDNQNYCKCDNCTALYEAEGSYAAATLQFTNNIATALKDEFPDILFETFAYQYTRNAPKTIKPAENVVVRICTIEECFSHPIGVDSDRLNSSDAMVKNNFQTDMEEWSEIAHTLWVWDYTTNYSEYQGPHANFNVLRENIRYFAENNVRGVYEQGHYQSEGAEFSGLRVYLISKLLWDPYMSEEEYQYHINDYMQEVYGPGWENVRAWFDLLHEELSDECFGCFYDIEDVYSLGEVVKKNQDVRYPEDLTSDMIRNYETVDWTKYWNFFKDIPEAPELVTKGHELWDAALAAAETDSQRFWIERDSLQVTYLESYYLYEQLYAGNSDIGKIIGYYMQDHPDEFTSAEVGTYRRAIIQLANSQAFAKYGEFNRELYDAYIKFGMNSMSHDYSNYLSQSEVDLTQRPRDWIVID